MDLTDGNTGTPTPASPARGGARQPPRQLGAERGNAMEPQHAGVVLNIPELDQCVHCGLCLNHCPTYRVTHLEPESPRGRIHLVRAVAEGRIEPLDPVRGTPNERFADHIYLCLMCRACETACPSGVQYGRIAEAAREVLVPRGQGCCGALNVHNGETVAARRMARRNVDVFLDAGVDAVIVNAAGCGAAMKEYGHLLRDDPDYAERAGQFAALVKDAGEFLAGLGLIPPSGRIEMTVTYQDPCHLAHGQKVRVQPRQLLAAIPGLRLVEMEGADRCCGSAGIYNITHPGMSQELLTEKMAAVGRTGAAAVVAPNPGCMLQLRFGAQRYGPALPVYHLMDLLDRAYGAD